MRKNVVVAIALGVVALAPLSATLSGAQSYNNGYHRGGHYRSSGYDRSSMVASGTSINVRVDSNISTENAQQGDTWTGTVSQSVYGNGGVVIPAGSPVTGVVASTAQGTHDTPAQIGLAVRSINVNGQSRTVYADTGPIVAGSSRAKKIGAIAGGAAAGALLGHVVAGQHHGTLIGGVLGGAAGYGLTRHAFRTLQIKQGTVVNFTTSGNVAYRR